MSAIRLIALFACLVGLCLATRGDEQADGDRSVDVPSQRLTVADTAAQIDLLFKTAWERDQVTPAAIATDSEYLRRVFLDLAGRTPAISEVREFLAEAAGDKRFQLVEQLLDSPAYVRNFTIVWRNALIPQAGSQVQFRNLIPGFDAWVWTHIATESPYDQMVREIITTPIGSLSRDAVLETASSPEAFFLVRQLQPENLATGTSRAFLGVRIDCAQCHDHPFDKWKQQQFWNMAAFYGGFQRTGAGEDENEVMAVSQEKADARTIRIPDTGEVVPAVFLTGLTPEWQPNKSSREILADWITSPKNPYFARMAVNRLWAQFFGQGIVQPVDDFSDHNPPSHPEALDLLAQQFVAHDFDVKFVIRVITATRVYQTGSRQTHASQADPIHFAVAGVRGLTPEQFFDSLAEAVGYYQPFRMNNPFVLDDNSPRSRFIELYRDEAESPLQRETTILQALAMMNGEFIQDATSLERSQTLRAVTEFPLMSDSEKLETLFLATLTRRPTEAETATLTEYIRQETGAGNASQALADVFWALLNSSEFLLNH